MNKTHSGTAFLEVKRIQSRRHYHHPFSPLYLELDRPAPGIPPETFEYPLGNHSALEWVIDQYQLKEDPRSGIKSDPNREDDPEYIVRLVGQVVRVSLDTVRIVKSLPAQFSDS